MGVYIKGMDMPTSCFECKLLDYTDAFKCRFRFESLAREHGINISRPSWCPLVPVPPHGRLIDADVLMENEENISFKDEWHMTVTEAFVSVKNIAHAPTIIEAEEGE